MVDAQCAACVAHRLCSCGVAPSLLRSGAVEFVPASHTAAPAHRARTMPRVMLRHDPLGGWGPSRCCSDWDLYITWVADVPGSAAQQADEWWGAALDWKGWGWSNRDA